MSKRLPSLRKILEVVETLPRNSINPTIERDQAHWDKPTCVYTAPNDPSTHCIAGEILVRLGMGDVLPDPQSDFNHQWTIDQLFTRQGVQAHKLGEIFLSRAQSVADKGVDGEGPVPWKIAITAGLEALRNAGYQGV